MISDSDEEGTDISERYIKSNDELQKFTCTDIPLRPYQLSGVNWLIGCYKKSHGSILGDEMGLGKTCQTIAFLAYVKKDRKQSIVVCPRSLLENWQEELERFAPCLKVQCYVGNKDKRHELANTISRAYRKGEQLFDILVTTYELCLKDDGFLSSLPWQVMVVDEAHRLKNNESLLYRTISQWDIDNSVLLTGTPVQNNLEELYSLLGFIAPRIFRRSGQERFVKKYGDVTKSKGVSELHDLLKPYLLRRTKEAVLKDLPVKTEIVMYHGISTLQKKLYKAILTKDVSVFENSQRYGGSSPRLMNILMQLRKCVNHPYLFDGVEPEPFELGEHLVEASGKLVLIDRLLSYCQSTGHKVLIFSQMTHMLDILQDYLGYREYTYERLDGSVRGEERFLAVQNFNKNKDTFVFLLSTKAGGQGLNLVAADTVIFVDSDFNPQNDLQAAARAHRIGQKRPVKIIRLVGRNTVEEIILKRAEDKLKLTEKVIEEGEFSLGVNKESLIADDHVPLQDILKFGVDTLLNEEDSADLDTDFKQMLGSSVDGEWQVEEESTVTEENESAVEQPSSMYVFEGTDYSKEPSAADKKAFDELIATEQVILEEKMTGERSMRKKVSTLVGLLPEVARKPRKQLTPEELEERNIKRKEAAEKRAKLAEEEEIRRARERRKKLETMWKANEYISSCVRLDSDDEEEDEEETGIDITDDEAKKDRSIHYISGDVTHPIKCDTEVNLIVHCADDSGRWGRGGLFTAISKRSPVPQEQYEQASKMKDIALGDCHLISLDDTESRDDVEDWLALVIAQRRDKKNNLSGIKLSSLNSGLKDVYKLAKARNGSVHLPRIGHDTPGFNWYGTERLIKKHLASRGIPTYIYYYPRKQHQKRKLDDSGKQHGNAKKKCISNEPSTSRNAEGNTSKSSNSTSGPMKLQDLFKGVTAYIHPRNIAADEIKKFKRHIIAYDGDMEVTFNDSVTHLIVHPDCDREEILGISGNTEDCQIVTCDWLSTCLKKGQLVSVQDFKYPITMAAT